MYGRFDPAYPRAIDDFAEKYYSNKELGYKPKTDKVEQYIESQPQTDFQRLSDRFFHYGVVRDLPNRAWWLSMSGLPSPEARATAFYGEWKKSSDEKKKELFDIAMRLEGFVSDRFAAKFMELGGTAPEPEKPKERRRIGSVSLVIK